jgi:serine/threonine protein kinase/formylglycine-generating enzyme required for sulfatase activity
MSPTAERWRQSREILLQALELPEEEQAAYLERACGGDETLHAEVQELLQHFDLAEQEGFLSTPGPEVDGNRLDQGSDAEQVRRTETESTVLACATPKGVVDSTVVVGPEAMVAAAQPNVPNADGRYRVISESDRLGAGGQGEVWRGIDQELGREVALKVLRANYSTDLPSRQRLVSEARITSELEHPGIVPVYGLEETPSDGRPRYAMRYVKGDTLTAKIKAFHQQRSMPAALDPANREGHPPQSGVVSSGSEAALQFRELLSHLVAVCKTVAFAHAHPRVFIHRDLKPDNVMVGQYGETIVMDWGLACPLAELRQADLARALSRALMAGSEPIADETTQVLGEPPSPDLVNQRCSDARRRIRTCDGELVGTPAYMSPEQAGAPFSLDQRTDVYGLGTILFYLLVNRPPHQAKPGESLQDVLDRIRREPDDPPAAVARNIPRPLNAICCKAMAYDPKVRYASADEMARELECYLADEPVAAYPESWSERLWRSVRKYPRRILGGFAVATVAAAVVMFLMWYIPHSNARSRRFAQIDSLVDRDPRTVVELVADLRSDTALAQPIVAKLRHLLRDAESVGNDQAARRLRLGLLAFEQAEANVASLFESLQTIRELEELRATRELLEQYTQTGSRTPYVGKLWAAVTDDGLRPDRRLRIACALAKLDPDNAAWSRHAALVVDLLERSDLQTALGSIDLLLPVGAHLREGLVRVFAKPRDANSEQVTAAAVVAFLFSAGPEAQGRVEELAELLSDATPRQHVVLLDRLPLGVDAPLLAALEARLAPSVTHEAPLDLALPENEGEKLKQHEQERERRASRQANAAAALLRLNPGRFNWGWLRHGSDPLLRFLLIHRIPRLSIPVRHLVGQLAREGDAAVRSGLLLAIGEYQPADLAAADFELVKSCFRSKSADEHAAARWALRRLGQDAWVQSELAVTVVRPSEGTNKAPARSPATPPSYDWWTNSQGHVMVALAPQPKGEFFWMGAREHEKAYASAEEPRFRARIDHPFAISSTETTVAQMERCLQGYRHRRDSDRTAADRTRPGDPAQQLEPASFVPLLHAMVYCNWLSQQEGIAKEQWCYDADKLAQYADDPIYAPEEASNIAFTADLGKRGYRLPTEVEWEYACRAGSQTTRFFGAPAELLDGFALYRGNSDANVLAPVASRMPNAFGLFDTLGNVGEWCHRALSSGSAQHQRGNRAATAPSVVDVGVPPYPLRGGTLNDEAAVVRCSYRILMPVDSAQRDMGFRVARTLEIARGSSLP